MDAGTPITNQHYIAAPKGEIYGADHGIARFNVELNATIRPQTPIKNLFLTGEFVLSKCICMPSRSSFWDSFRALHFCICFSWCLEWRMCNVPWFIPILFQIWTLLTGQDVMLCGFAGALTGALTCGSVILNRNLHLDAIALAKRVKNGNNKKKD